MSKNITCKICDKEFSNFRGLSNHLRFSHSEISSKEYHDIHLKAKSDGICHVCKKPTRYKSISIGYLKYCSNLCSQNDADKTEKESILLKKL